MRLSLLSLLCIARITLIATLHSLIQSAKLITDGTPAFDEKRTSRPYKWAQHLAGIDFLPEVSPLLAVHDALTSAITKTDAVMSGLSLYRQQNRVQTVVRRIRSRKKAQVALV